MKRTDLAGRLAQHRQITQAEAADQLDSVVHRILKKLRAGRPAALPGLGVIKPGNNSVIRTVGKPARKKRAKRPRKGRR